MMHPTLLLALGLAACALLPAAVHGTKHAPWAPVLAPQVDAVLFRTHFVDALIVKKLRELAASSELPPGVAPGSSAAVAVADDGALPPLTTSRSPVAWEVTVLFDLESTPDFPRRLEDAGFNHSAHGVQLMGLTLRDFTHYPNVKPVREKKRRA
jgi:hypothetical protein